MKLTYEETRQYITFLEQELSRKTEEIAKLKTTLTRLRKALPESGSGNQSPSGTPPAHVDTASAGNDEVLGPAAAAEPIARKAPKRRGRPKLQPQVSEEEPTRLHFSHPNADMVEVDTSES